MTEGDCIAERARSAYLYGLQASGVVPRLSRELNRPELFYYGTERTVCHVLEPLFVSRTCYERHINAARRTFASLLGGTVQALSSPRLVEQLRLPSEAVAFASAFADSHPVYPSTLARLDGFLDHSGELRFVENNPNPGGLAWSHHLNDAFEQSGALKGVRSRFRISPVDVVSVVAPEPLLDLSADREPLVIMPARPRMDPVDHQTKLFLELVALHANLTVVLADPAELALAGSALVWRGRRVHAVVPNPIEQEIFFDNSAITGALNTGAVRPLFSFPAELSGMKQLFELLTDEPTERTEAHVPWTRVLYERQVCFRGSEVSLVDLVCDRPDDFVVKPAYGEQGDGVLMGLSTDDWRATLRAALDNQEVYIVQERIRIPTRPFAIWRGNDIIWEARSYSLDPFCLGDRAILSWGRCSEAQVVNATQGGDIFPIFIVEDGT